MRLCGSKRGELGASTPLNRGFLGLGGTSGKWSQHRAPIVCRNHRESPVPAYLHQDLFDVYDADGRSLRFVCASSIVPQFRGYIDPPHRMSNVSLIRVAGTP
jgi:hypothetical protein